MKYNEYHLQAKVWQYPGMAGWHFVSISQEITEDIDKGFKDRKRGWGSLPVEAQIRDTTWKTSIFPDKRTSQYLMPLKASVRKKEKIMVGDIISLVIEIAV